VWSMQDDKDETTVRETIKAKPYRVHLPGFVSDEEIGLGGAVKRVTYAMGIRPCGSCERRAAALNRWVVFTR